jgi:hypothetical protein
MSVGAKSMPAEFYIDRNGSTKGPGAAIEILRGDYSTIDLTGLWDGSNNQLRLSGTDALLMMGTTAELQQALYAAKSQDVISVAIPGEDKVIWYVRRRAGLETKTVASLASLSQYWALVQDDPRLVPGGWYQLYEGLELTGYALDLGILADWMLPRARGVTAWY